MEFLVGSCGDDARRKRRSGKGYQWVRRSVKTVQTTAWNGRLGRGLLLVAVCIALVVMTALPVLGRGAPARASTTWDVSMYGDDMSGDYEFVPAAINITVGDTVNWTSVAGSHTSTSAPNQAEWWDSGVVARGDSFAHTFTVPGSYNYSSLIDPQMYGVVNVQSPTPTPEFPGFGLAIAVALAAFVGLLLERKLRS
ncbi:MAG TPA: hypothetical protein VMS77_00940 [Conexivisphaerales archaeon]|nr:hypothetical protein [Conexivisphaerales archaeon]